MSKAARFWDSWSQRYAKQTIADEAAYQTKLQQTQNYLNPTMEVIEFGCGTGSTALIHAPHVKHIRAIDISPKMIDIATHKATKEGIGNVSFEVNTLDILNNDMQSVDAILGLSVLHLLDDWQASIAIVHGLLKPGGIFVSSTPCLSRLRLLKLTAPIGQFFGVLPNLSFFSEAELKQTLANQGFEIEHSWQPKKNAASFIIARKLP